MLVSQVAADCPNACSGHGTCSNAYDTCQCYRMWTGNDCSQRMCPSGRAFVDSGNGDVNSDGVVGLHLWTASSSLTDNKFGDGIPVLRNSLSSNRRTWERNLVDAFGPRAFSALGQVADEGHFYSECSSRGLCDRASGICQCFPGFEGLGCRRMACPNDCSGHGVCKRIAEAADFGSTYNLWDVNAARTCQCDYGWNGYDCSSRRCPYGDDPLHTNSTGSEVQAVYVKCNSAAGNGVEGTMKLEFSDAYGQTWVTNNITLDSSNTVGATTVASNVASALEGMPNGALEDVDVTVTFPSHASDYAAQDVLIKVTFSSNPGDQHLLGSDVRGVNCNGNTFTTTDTVNHYKTTGGGNTNTECSNRGLCDGETGACTCFKGYTGDDCGTQDALAA